MAAEAQRLMSLSLGKIAASRGQRGGVNLHKNLLVASVLFKARTVFIHETHTVQPPRPQTPEPSPEESETNSNSHVDSLSSCRLQSTDSTTSAEPVVNPGHSDAGESMEMESQNQDTSSYPSCAFERDARGYNHVEDDNEDRDDKENSPPSGPVYQEIGSISQKDSNCARCTKRRLAEDNTNYDSDDEGDKDSGVKSSHSRKRVKTSHHSEPSSYSTTTVTDQSTQVEPMQTDSPQITSLVQRFNNGLTGLLGKTCSQSSSSSSQSPLSSSDEGTNGKDSRISCSTQIKEAFETLARPVIALTV